MHRIVWAIPEERPLMTEVRWVGRLGLHGDKYFQKVKVTYSCPTFWDLRTTQSMEFSRPEYWSG